MKTNCTAQGDYFDKVGVCVCVYIAIFSICGVSLENL